MATRPPEEIFVQVATRVPQALLDAVLAWCIEHDVNMMAFVADAIRDKLRRTRIREL